MRATDVSPSGATVVIASGELADAVAAVADPGGVSENGDGKTLGLAPDVPETFDEAAETAFLAEARERGEVVTAVKPADLPEEIVDAKALPPLDDLVKRIPVEVRETLEDLFRARFVAVRRMPAKALKS